MPSIEINGQQHELFCGLTEHQALWKITGKNLLAGENLTAGINPGNLAQVVHAMLRGEVSVDQITASLGRTKKLVEALRAVVDTINDGLEDATDAEENPSQAA